MYQFIALARFNDTVDWSDLKLWVYVVYLGGVLVLGLYGLSRSWSVERVHDAAAPVAPAG